MSKSSCFHGLYFFDKTTESGGATFAKKSAVKNENISNKELAKELHKSIIRKLEKKKVNSPFIDKFGCWSRWYAINKEI